MYKVIAIVRVAPFLTHGVDLTQSMTDFWVS